jgi:hypothetical protein
MLPMAGRVVSVFFMLVLAVAVAACSDNKKPEATGDTNVFPKDYKHDIIITLRKLFEKNETVRVTDAFIFGPVLRPVGNEQHYVACLRYTAHGAQPGVIGRAERVAYFYRGELNQLIPANDQCVGVAYQPFPELNAVCMGKGCK